MHRGDRARGQTGLSERVACVVTVPRTPPQASAVLVWRQGLRTVADH